MAVASCSIYYRQEAFWSFHLTLMINMNLTLEAILCFFRQQIGSHAQRSPLIPAYRSLHRGANK